MIMVEFESISRQYSPIHPKTMSKTCKIRRVSIAQGQYIHKLKPISFCHFDIFFHFQVSLAKQAGRADLTTPRRLIHPSSLILHPLCLQHFPSFPTPKLRMVAIAGSVRNRHGEAPSGLCRRRSPAAPDQADSDILKGDMLWKKG